MRAQSEPLRTAACDSTSALGWKDVTCSGTGLIIASLAFWRPFPSAFWLRLIGFRSNWRRELLEICWFGFLAVLFIAFFAPTWQLRYSMVHYPWLQRTVLTPPPTDLWTVDKEVSLEYMANVAAPPDAPWLQERIEDLWGEEVGVGWIEPLESEELNYYVNTMIGQEHLLGDY